METQTSINTETNYTEHALFPISYDITNNKEYFNEPLPNHFVPENNSNNMDFQPKQSYSSLNYKVRSLDQSASPRLVTDSRSRSIESRLSQSPLKKKLKEVAKSRNRSTSYSHNRQYSSSWSNPSRSRSRSRSMDHCNRGGYYNNCNRDTYYKPHFQNKYHNRGFKNYNFQHRGRYVHRPNYDNYYNNWNNRGQRGGQRQRFFH